MKESLTLGPAGVRALVALCAHNLGHGSMAVDAKFIAAALLGAAGAPARWSGYVEDGVDSGRASLKRLADSRAELRLPQSTEGRS